MNVDGQQETIRISDNCALAPMEALAGVKSTWATGLRRPSRLAVDTASRRLRLAPELPPRLPDQGSDDPVPPASVAPRIEIALDRRIRRELAWQSSPLAAGGQNVEDRLHDLAQIDFPRAPPSPPRRHLPGNQRPFR